MYLGLVGSKYNRLTVQTVGVYTDLIVKVIRQGCVLEYDGDHLRKQEQKIKIFDFLIRSSLRAVSTLY